jgi:hypothetical protein
MAGNECSSLKCSSLGNIRGTARKQKNRQQAGSSIVHNVRDDDDEQQKHAPLQAESPPLRFVQEEEDENDVDMMEAERKPLHYWDDLRKSGIPFETRDGSAMYKLVDPSDGEIIRLGHVANIYPYSEILSDGTRTPNESLIYIEAGMFLAIKTFNERSPSILPNLPEILRGCNIYLTMDILDTILSPIVASEKALSAMNRPPNSLQEPLPISLAGAFRSAVTQPLATLSGVYQVPHVNGQSTSSVLDQKDQAPTFTRVVPTNRMDAKAYILYLKSLGVVHFATLFVRDAYGNEFNRDLRVAAAEYNIHMTSVSYQDGDNNSIDRAIAALKGHQHRYIFTVITPSAGTLKYILREAINQGILGVSDHFWMFSEAVTALLEPGFYQSTLDSSLESDREIAAALSGTGLLILEIPKNDPFDAAMQELRTDEELYDYFVSRHDAPEVFGDFSFRPVNNFYQQLSYDAIMSLGIGLCGISEEFPTGIDVVEAIKATEFVGVSGLVRFDNYTGTRKEDSLNFKVINLIVDPSEESIEFRMPTSALISMTSGEVNVVTPFVYSQGTYAPPQLPPASVDTNLMSNGVRAVGWTLAAIAILLSAVFGLWTWLHRKKNYVRVSQPAFLCLLCAGTALMATTIIPLSLQEPVSDRGLDIACMAAPWLFTLGFAMSVASVLFKMIRLNRLFKQSADMHRVVVKAKHFMLPVSIYMLANFAILLTWTLVAPLQWTRVKINNFDSWGRSLASYGTCYAHLDDGKKDARLAFACTLAVLNLLVLLFANYEGYRSRLVPSAFNETYYLALSMAGVLEAFLIGIPLIFLARDTPTAMFMILSILITTICMALLLPTFVSKIIIRRRASTAAANPRHPLNSSSMKRAWGRYDAANRSHHSSHSGPQSRRPSASSVEAIRERAAQRPKEDSSQDEFSSRNQNVTVAEIRRRVNASKDQKEPSQQNINRT